MPLRDHFHPPLFGQHQWESFHAMWPTVIVQHLVPHLPDRYIAAPRVRLGVDFEVDVGATERAATTVSPNGGTATLTALAPTWTCEADIGDPDEYEVRVYDVDDDRRLVAAIEIVSPRNKDRPAARAAFAVKTATLLRRGVCVSVVDFVTNRRGNMYADALDLIGQTDPTLGTDPPPLYAVTCRRRSAHRTTFLDSWFYPLAVGRPLPPIPLWLDDETRLTVDLEASYEETCRTLRVP